MCTSGAGGGWIGRHGIAGQNGLDGLMVSKKQALVPVGRRAEPLQLSFYRYFDFAERQTNALCGQLQAQLQQGAGAGVIYGVYAVALQHHVADAGLCLQPL